MSSDQIRKKIWLRQQTLDTRIGAESQDRVTWKIRQGRHIKLSPYFVLHRNYEVTYISEILFLETM